MRECKNKRSPAAFMHEKGSVGTAFVNPVMTIDRRNLSTDWSASELHQEQKGPANKALSSFFPILEAVLVSRQSGHEQTKHSQYLPKTLVESGYKVVHKTNFLK